MGQINVRTNCRRIGIAPDAIELFKHVCTDEESFLFESAAVGSKYGEKTIGSIEICLKVSVKEGSFEIVARNEAGKKIIEKVKNEFDFAECLEQEDSYIKGYVQAGEKFTDEESRLKAVSVFDVLRKINNSFFVKNGLDYPHFGMFGAIGYDAIDYFEKMPAGEKQHEDMVFYIPEKIFVIDHFNNETYFVLNDISGVNDFEKDYQDFRDNIYRTGNINEEEQKLNNSSPEYYPDMSDSEYEERVKQIKEHIRQGDVFQCVVSRNFSAKINDDPINIYARLKKINPSPYMFYLQTDGFVLLGASPETFLKVSGESMKKVEIRPIAGTIKRGKSEGVIDSDKDSRYELELLLDKKELAEHSMLLDLARNDVARISVPGTRKATRILNVEKYSHVQHLVSTVEGELKPNLDFLHAYTASMNMGTLTGAPKLKATELIRNYESSLRGFYGGSVCYMTPQGDFDSCIVIRSMIVQDKVAHIRAGAGIVHDSVPENESRETENKAKACLEALK